MTCLDALVNGASQRLVARKTTRDLGNVARDVTAELVSAMTPLLCENWARRTLRLTVARVLYLCTSTYTRVRMLTPTAFTTAVRI